MIALLFLAVGSYSELYYNAAVSCCFLKAVFIKIFAPLLSVAAFFGATVSFPPMDCCHALQLVMSVAVQSATGG
jgi:hypothetical protein